MQMLTIAREYTLTLATFANKLETCNGKIKGLCQNPQLLNTDFCDIARRRLLLEAVYFSARERRCACIL